MRTMSRMLISILTLALIVMLTIPMIAVAEEEMTPFEFRKIVYISGTPYERGYQLGYQTGDVYKLNAQLLWDQKADIGRREDLIKYLYNYEETIVDFAPGIIERMHGIADGAIAAGGNLTYEDVLMVNWYWNLPPPGFASHGCSSFGAWGNATEDGEPLWTINDDSGFFPDAYYTVEVGFSENGKAWVYPEAQNPSCGMNSDGLVMATQWNPALPEDEAYGMTEALIVAWILQNATSVEEAKELLRDTITNPPSRYYILMDSTPQMVAVEATPTEQYLRKPGDNGEEDFMVVTNHFLSEEWDGRYGPPDSEHWNYNSLTRYLTVFKNIETNYGNINPDNVAREIMSSRESWNGTNWVGVDVFREGVNSKYAVDWAGNLGGTKGNYVFLPKDRVVRMVIGPPDGSFPGTLGADGYVTLALKESPSATNKQMGAEAINQIIVASERLEKGLIPDDLSSMLEDAVGHYYQGLIATTRASAATTTLDSVILLSEASTHFARAQAYANYAINKSD